MPKNLKRACKKIFSVYSAVQNDSELKNEYGIENEKEFVAELSNPEFVRKLKHTYASGWHMILEGVCRLLGINKHFTVYDKLMSAVDVILSNPDYQLASAYYSSIDGKRIYYLDSAGANDR